MPLALSCPGLADRSEAVAVCDACVEVLQFGKLVTEALKLFAAVVVAIHISQSPVERECEGVMIGILGTHTEAQTEVVTLYVAQFVLVVAEELI